MRVHQQRAHRCPTYSHTQTNPTFGVQILENTMKGKESNCIGKSTSDSTNREKVDREAKNIEDLVKRKRRGDMSSTTALDRTRSAMGNGNMGIGGGRVI